jgi:hypothetical protein
VTQHFSSGSVSNSSCPSLRGWTAAAPSNPTPPSALLGVLDETSLSISIHGGHDPILKLSLSETVHSEKRKKEKKKKKPS